MSYHYRTYSTHKSYVLLIPRDPYNPSKMTKNNKEVTVEAIENYDIEVGGKESPIKSRSD